MCKGEALSLYLYVGTVRDGLNQMSTYYGDVQLETARFGWQICQQWSLVDRLEEEIIGVPLLLTFGMQV